MKASDDTNYRHHNLQIEALALTAEGIKHRTITNVSGERACVNKSGQIQQHLKLLRLG